MRVCITEKPSVARDIAKILGANTKRDGYFEGNGYQVTWTYGHLCTLKDPSDYTDSWKRWTLSSLPMIPDRFGIKLIEQEGYKKQFEVIKSLIDTADDVINCGDAGQEGELIQRWVLQKAGNTKPVKRLWISSLTDEAIKQGFDSLKDSKEFDNLYYAGLSRAIGDWLLGLNSTRLYSLRYSHDRRHILSVGRVQTPTLAMIVERQKEIDEFKSKDYWELRVFYRNIWFNASPAKKYGSEADGLKIINRLKGNEFTIEKIEQKNGKEFAPRLFDLTSLQVECNTRFGWSADETLRLIQSLYEKKLTTYPRVDTTYLSEDMFAQVPEILQKLTPYKKYTEEILKTPLTRNKRIFDNAKITDHHAIIPTGISPSILTDTKERQLYHLIATRFIANFYPECRFSTTVVMGKVGEQLFKTSGKTILEPGWRDVIGTQTSETDKEDDKMLPEFTEGEHGDCELDLQKKTTQAPKYFTEATLLKAMETAGKSVDNEELRDALKENGIGRPSTRASIIETLLKRGYIERQKKRLIATEAGKSIIAVINDDLLKSAKLTGIWENRLRRIERGEYSASEFISQLKDQLHGLISDVLNDTTLNKIKVEKKGPEKASKKSAKKTFQKKDS